MPSQTIDEPEFRYGINKEIERETLELINSKDWPDFKERRGRILGLKKALQVEADAAVDEDDDFDND